MIKKIGKLIRDNVPEIIAKDGGVAEVSILDDGKFKVSLKEKLVEETAEIAKSQDSTNLKEELSDLLEIIESIAGTEGSNLEEIIAIKKAKKVKVGGFDKKLYLVSVTRNEQ